MPWLADVARTLEREPALLTAPCACCASNPCRCSPGYCRDTLACCLHCSCDRCTDARRYPQRDHRRDARRRIDSGAVFFRGTDGRQDQPQAARPGATSEPKEAPRATTSP